MTLQTEHLQFGTIDYRYGDKEAYILGLKTHAVVSNNNKLRIIKFPKYINYNGTQYKITDIGGEVYYDLIKFDNLKKVIVPKGIYVGVPNGVIIEEY